MQRKNDSKPNIEELTDAQISAAISHLDPDSTQARSGKSESLNASFMQVEDDSKLKINELTDPEIAAAIRYLDPRPAQTTSGKSDNSVLLVGLYLLALLLGCVGVVIWLWANLW